MTRQQSISNNSNMLTKSQSEVSTPILTPHSNKNLSHSNTEVFTMDDINVEYLKAILFKFFEFKDKKVIVDCDFFFICLYIYYM